ncbi:hypothetical protein ACOMHN_007795 [Nucella lapillus]
MTLIQIAVSFDTTGSMSRALVEVRTRLTEMIRLLKKDIPGVTLSIIAHGDYCDKDIYVTKHLDFTDDESALVSFVRDVKDTGGGDAPECYELVLRLVRTKLSWKRKSQKILVVIGDAYPHPPDDPQNEDRIDWEEEARLLAGMPMRIYGAQINDDRQSTEFFRKLTSITGGSHLKLTEFSVLTDVITAVCYRTVGTAHLMNLERDVRARYAPKPLHKDLEEVFAVLHEPLAVPTVSAKNTSSRYTYRGKDVSFSWGGQVTPSQPLSWKDPGDDDDSVHKLQIKLAVLGPEAKMYEANIVEMETTNFQEEKLTQPIIHMVGGKDTMASLDLSFNSPVTFRLVSGAGPVYLSGQHVAKALQEGGEEWEAYGASSKDKVSDESTYGTPATSVDSSEDSTPKHTQRRASTGVSADRSKSPSVGRSEIPERDFRRTFTASTGPTGSSDGDSTPGHYRRRASTGISGSRPESPSPNISQVFEHDLQSTFNAVSRLYGTARDEGSPSKSSPAACKTS